MHRPCGFQHDSQEATLNKGCKLVLDKQCACPWKTNWSGSNCVHPSNILRFGAAVTEPPARGRQLLSAAMSWGLAAPATPRPTGGCRKTGVSVNGQLASPGGGRSPAQPLQGATTEDSGDAGTRLVDSWWGIGTPDHAAGSGAATGPRTESGLRHSLEVCTAICGCCGARKLGASQRATGTPIG
mmetsp:Transcript_61803/g.119060  ORF Transcript_61803/g.119060 Transcript_61803/m.119060 type:complete len:184 (+) Transcript_61803:99-650(+)